MRPDGSLDSKHRVGRDQKQRVEHSLEYKGSIQVVKLHESKETYQTYTEICEAWMKIQSNMIIPQYIDADDVPWNKNNKIKLYIWEKK